MSTLVMEVARVADGPPEKEIEPTALGTFIRRRRQELKLSQGDLGKRLDFHHTYISQIERGRLPDMDAPDFIDRWARALEIERETLITEGELWRYNLVPPGPDDLTPGQRAIIASVAHLDDQTHHKIAQGLRAMYGEDGQEPPPAPVPED